jgi:hypothetical protein
VSGGRGAAIERALCPTPYATELIAEDVAHAGQGARLEIDVAGMPANVVVALETGVAQFSTRGITVIWSGSRVGPLAIR